MFEASPLLSHQVGSSESLSARHDRFSACSASGAGAKLNVCRAPSAASTLVAKVCKRMRLYRYSNLVRSGNKEAFGYEAFFSALRQA